MLRVLFFVEGFTDIRYVTGLAAIADLTLCVPEGAYASSGLKDRVAASGARVHVHEIPGGRLAYQWRSLAWLWQHAREFHVIHSQELLRGSLNATIVGRLRGVPVVTTMLLAPVEYFRCRRERGQIGMLEALAGEVVIRTLMSINGRLSTRCAALGLYLQGVARQYCARTVPGWYYGVDTGFYSPGPPEQRTELRRALDLPERAFLIFLASRISHEKDPETVLRATYALRQQGHDAVLLNLSGGYREFIDLAGRLGLPDADAWVIGRPPAHPMHELANYFRAADVVAQASLAEGLGLSPLEALACGTPVVATDVGGMSTTLPGHAHMVPVRDVDAMTRAFAAIAADPEAARRQALEGRRMVERDWSRERAFAGLRATFEEVAAATRGGQPGLP
ncbi:MAG: glycosyltransferase [Vicinamibacterales bacterium]